MPIPLCNIPFTEEERQHYDSKPGETIEENIKDMINSDCWAVKINGVVYMNTYDLVEKINYCFNMDSDLYRSDALYEAQQKWRKKVTDDPTIVLSSLKTVDDSIEIYMFGDHSWMMEIKKTEKSEYKYKFFKSEEGLYPML